MEANQQKGQNNTPAEREKIRCSRGSHKYRAVCSAILLQSTTETLEDSRKILCMPALHSTSADNVSTHKSFFAWVFTFAGHSIFGMVKLKLC